MRRIIIATLIVCSFLEGWAQANRFCIAKDGKTASVIVDVDDWKGVIRAARNLSDDVRKVNPCRYHRQEPYHRRSDQAEDDGCAKGTWSVGILRD